MPRSAPGAGSSRAADLGPDQHRHAGARRGRADRARRAPSAGSPPRPACRADSRLRSRVRGGATARPGQRQRQAMPSAVIRAATASPRGASRTFASTPSVSLTMIAARAQVVDHVPRGEPDAAVADRARAVPASSPRRARPHLHHHRRVDRAKPETAFAPSLLGRGGGGRGGQVDVAAKAERRAKQRQHR